MAMYTVKWHLNPSDPRSSCWYELSGVITYASALLKEWEGGSHAALVRYLHRRDLAVYWTSKHCVPPTLKYHKELLATVNSTLLLLGNLNG